MKRTAPDREEIAKCWGLKLDYEDTLPVLVVSPRKQVRFCGSVSCYMANCALHGGTMKRAGTKSAGKTLTNPPVPLTAHWTGQQQETVVGFLNLLAQMLNAAQAGDNIYMTIGMNRERSSYLITLVDDGTKQYAGGDSMWAMLDQAVDELL